MRQVGEMLAFYAARPWGPHWQMRGVAMQSVAFQMAFHELLSMFDKNPKPYEGRISDFLPWKEVVSRNDVEKAVSFFGIQAEEDE